jgi:hypothetical protein
MLEEGADNQRMLRGFKNLMCPLCLNVMYKCTTAACGHSFCERCLDEYLIIKKVGAASNTLNHCGCSNASSVMSW